MAGNRPGSGGVQIGTRGFWASQGFGESDFVFGSDSSGLRVCLGLGSQSLRLARDGLW